MSFQISSEAYESLCQRGLLPPEDVKAGLLPSEPQLPAELYSAKARGSLIGGAIGDVLGRPAEGRPPAQVERVYGRLTDFIPWGGWQGGPRGTVTDDTQLTMCVARCLVECGCLDPEDLVRRAQNHPLGNSEVPSVVLALTTHATCGIRCVSASKPLHWDGSSLKDVRVISLASD